MFEDGFVSMPDTAGVFVISVAAELAGLHPQTLRIYERRGLLDPARTGGGSRRYSQADIAQLRRILDLTNAGLNLEGVKRVLALEAEVARLQLEVIELRRAGAEAVARTHRQYRRDLVPLSQAPAVFVGSSLPRPWH
ncbi:MAG: heat shock protein transcriptional repressor HspR [Acidimicrobiales bacterium]